MVNITGIRIIAQVSPFHSVHSGHAVSLVLT
jgi:hypothetical protein